MAQTIPQPCGERTEHLRDDRPFAPTSSPIRRAQSLTVGNSRFQGSLGSATVSSGISTEHSNVHSSGFVEQARLALQSLRLSFESERAAFAEERKLWERERTIMKQRIAELEQEQRKASRIEKNWMALKPSGKDGAQAHDAHHIWEGSSPTLQPTRVFWEEEEEGEEERSSQGPKHSGSINIGHGLPPSLDDALSPTARPVDRPTAVGVPIELVDSSLDGITLKSTALAPDIVAKASSTSPSDAAPPSLSPTQTPDPNPKSTESKKPLHLVLSELGPPEENLVRDAGHTPMTVINHDADTSNISTEVGTLTMESPLAPQQTLESGVSYFPAVDEDKALQGPLGLRNDEKQDIEFLEALDQKLLTEAKKLTEPGPGSDLDESESNISGDEQQLSASEQEAGIKFKHSTNFGSAFGTL
ncbi:hypothetical protein ACJ72_04282 [Emergomyces africanus]|uniref:Uncharacterized protein n=1 Tax=Emergomyces africanus TaxID=1955775 RepID=A0A1B7NX82_9EURO|nr:hypothetical protein ACJ72_04282 [Emergomyces africanus]